MAQLPTTESVAKVGPASQLKMTDQSSLHLARL